MEEFIVTFSGADKRDIVLYDGSVLSVDMLSLVLVRAYNGRQAAALVRLNFGDEWSSLVHRDLFEALHGVEWCSRRIVHVLYADVPPVLVFGAGVLSREQRGWCAHPPERS